MSDPRKVALAIFRRLDRPATSLILKPVNAALPACATSTAASVQALRGDPCATRGWSTVLSESVSLSDYVYQRCWEAQQSYSYR